MVEAEEQIIYPIVHFLLAHIILLQSVAHKDLLSQNADRPGTAHAPHQVMRRVIIGLDLHRHGSAGCLVDLHRPFHPDRFVWTHLIEFFPKLIEFLLLGSQTASRRDGGVLLQRPVHSLMHSILLRLPGFDQLGVDTQLDEPHRQLRQPCQGIRCERHPIICSNAIGQSVDVK